MVEPITARGLAGSTFCRTLSIFVFRASNAVWAGSKKMPIVE
jgi:hypothetical protein